MAHVSVWVRYDVETKADDAMEAADEAKVLIDHGKVDGVPVRVEVKA